MKRVRIGITIAAALASGLALDPAQLHAAPPRSSDRGATDGVDRVYHDYSGQGDASSLELNPALLSTIKGLDLTVRGYQPISKFTRGQGFGGFWAVNLGFGLGMGFGAQFIRPRLDRNTFDFDESANPSLTKLSWGLAGGFGERASFGLAVHGARVDGRWLQSPDVDIGVVTRATPYASLGAVLRVSPAGVRPRDLPSETSVIGELALRPLGTHNLEIAGGVKQRLYLGDPGEALERQGIASLLARGRVSVRYQGIAIRGEVEQVATTALDPGSFAALRPEKALRGSVSLQASWDFASAGAGVHAGVSDGLDGVGFHARLHTQTRGRIFWPRTVDVQRIALGSLGDQRSLLALLEQIELAASAGKRSVLLLDARGVGASWGQLHELREALVRARNRGAHIFAYLEGASLADYYMASAAQKVFMHPAGSVEAFGLSSQGLYYRGALDKIGVGVEVIKIKEYKSAGERFSETGPTAPDREQREALQADIYAKILGDIGRGRGLTPAAVRDLFNDAPHGPQQALANGLVDEVLFRDELTAKISSHIGATVEFRDISDTRPEDKVWSRAPYIAVVVVEGAIVDGDSRFLPFFKLRFTGGDTIAQTLREVRADRACKGIVLRVDSPGGSALASDIIWREVSLTHEAFKANPKGSPPIVVSMSGVAASGGYYVAMGTDVVLTDPMTVTGSIGVITMHFDVSGLLEKLGISVATFKEGKNPDMGSLFAPYTDDQRGRVEASIARVYDLFTSRVAKARSMTPEKVNELARGHVYSGTRAHKLGLVDELGGLHEAVALLRRKAGVAKFRELDTRVYPKQLRLLDLLLNNSGSEFAKTRVMKRVLARRDRVKAQSSLRAAVPLALNEALAKLPLSLLFLPQGQAQAVMPYTIEF